MTNQHKTKLYYNIFIVTAILSIASLITPNVISSSDSELLVIVKYKKQKNGSFSRTKMKKKDIDRTKANQEVEYIEVDSLQSPQVESVSFQEGAINAPLAWAKMINVTNKTIVAVCDSGVESTHPDLQQNLRKDLGYDVYNRSKLGWDTIENPHGTMVSGVIAATANNDIGTRGVTTKVEIMPLKMTFDSTGDAYLSTMANCIKYAVDNGAKVVNVSFGGATSYLIQDVASYAMSRNVNVVFSMGNEYKVLTSRNNFNVIAVGATDSNNNIAPFSNTGRPVDLVAPGVGILTTTRGGGYASVSGTSFSSPIVAGVIAMARGKNPTNDLGAVGYDTTFGFGLVDANKMVI
jgi:thermitase